MSTYVVGDIQGCYKPLRRLLKKIEFNADKDELWCVGDLINRGPKSLDTLRYLKDLGPSATVVLGNHDLHFLAIYYGCAPHRSKDTLQKLLDAPDSEQLSTWLRHQPLVHYDAVETEWGMRNYLMVHAGVPPQWGLQKTLNLAAEVELALQGPDYLDYFNNMYGDKPKRWKDSLVGPERLRVITNYLTRMRFCTAKGILNLQVKEGLGSQPEGLYPWYELEQLTPETRILFGHWAAIEGQTNNDYVHALDTGCVWGRALTMLRLEDERLFSL
ncbi:MAG: symmetrical bis(5'-nucleosyl)-tetraphosphatase [Pseudohongiellaceae bacterium]|nr:symmetrical bis(5'-nucleosyl)-tetraphosphatase [Pseudohongiellaceae bacterium]